MAGPIDPIKWNLHHHGRLIGQHCRFEHCCCIAVIDAGECTAAETEAGCGNLGGEILNVGGGKQFHVIFYSQPDFAPESAWVNVDIPWDLPQGVAHVLGYESVQVLPGIYPYSPGTSTYGDLYFSATVGSAVPEFSSWGMVSGALALLLVGGMFLSKRLGHAVKPSIG